MKKTIVSSLVLSLIPGLCLGVNDRIYKLIQEKQQKMEKLEKCQGTTKNLKIAGISTLGITAVGIGANIAEAVVLDKAKDQVKDAKVARDAQLKIKEDRIQREEQDHQLFVNLCNSFGGNLLENQTACNVVKKEFADYESSVFAARQSGGKCQASTDTEKSKITECEYPNKHILSIGWFWTADKQQNSGQGGNGNQQGNGGKDGKQGDAGNKGGANGGQGGQQQNQETTQTHVIHKVLTLPEISNEIKDTLKKPESKCSDASAKSTWLSGYTWTAKCDKIEHTFTFDGVKCAANQAFDTDTGECLSQTKAKKPLKERCDAAYGNQGEKRLACCYAGTTTEWNPNTKTCKCVDTNLEWNGKTCVVKKDNGNQGGVAGNDGKGGNAQGNQQGGNQGGQQGGAEPAPKGGNNPAQTPSGEKDNGNQNGQQQGGASDGSGVESKEPNQVPGTQTQPQDEQPKEEEPIVCPDNTKYDEKAGACVKVEYIVSDRVKGEKEEIGSLISSYLLRDRSTCGRLEYEFAHDKVWKVKCEDSDLEFNFNLTGLFCEEDQTLSSSKGLCEGPITKTFKLGEEKWVDIWNLMYDKLPDNCKASAGDYSYTPYKTQWIIKCKTTDTTYIFDFAGVVCDNNETFDSANGECVAPEDTKTVKVTGVGENSFLKEVPIDTPADETDSIFSSVSTVTSMQAIALARMYMKFNHGHDDVCNPDKEQKNTIRCSNKLFPFAGFSAKPSVANEGIARSVCEYHGRSFRDHVCVMATKMECMEGTSSVYNDIRTINPSMYVTYTQDGLCKITW